MYNKKANITVKDNTGNDKEATVYYDIEHGTKNFPKGKCNYCQSQNVPVRQDSLEIEKVIIDYNDQPENSGLYKKTVSKLRGHYKLGSAKYCEKNECLNKHADDLIHKYDGVEGN